MFYSVETPNNVETRRATFVQAAKAGIGAVIVGVEETKPLPNR